MKTDAQLQHDVIAELSWEPSIHATHIGVEVQDGIVTLAGEVASYAEKVAAERAALNVSGVKALAVEMKVKISGFGQRSDTDIARSVENVLLWTSFLPADSVKVKVENGWITLTGEVGWQYQKQGAIDAVRNLMGVTGVSDQIVIKLGATERAVKSDIEAALRRRAIEEAREIQVEVRGADVTLTGTIHSWSERELATHTAWSSPGVRKVIDHLRLVP